MARVEVRDQSFVAAFVIGALILAVVVGAKWRETDTSIKYDGRTYLNPGPISAEKVAEDWAPLQDVGVERRGMDLLVPVAQLRADGDPTVVLLRRDDGSYLIYGLSGGP